jgi:hypothetical protein
MDIAYTFSYITDPDYTALGIKLIFAWKTILGYGIPNNNKLHLAIKELSKKSNCAPGPLVHVPLFS